MIHVALTGNIASGKTAVAELFRRWGATIIDSDRLVYEAQAPGSPTLAAIAARFGREMILPDGSLDRPRLRAAILGNDAARKDLNAIVHPEVQRRRTALVEEARRRGDRVIVSDIPLLFEVLDPGAFDAVVLVDAPEPVRKARLMEQRGLTADQAIRMMALQLPAAEKRRWRGGPHNRPALVIENDGTMAELERRAREVWEGVVRTE